MSLALIGKEASYEFRWRRWALLRDVVAHHLEGDVGGSRFPRLAGLGDCMVQGGSRLPAAELGAELAEIRKELAGRGIDQLVMGPGTAQVLYLGATIRGLPRPLTAAEATRVAPTTGVSDLAEYFGSLLDGLEEVCRNPCDDGTLEAIDV
ncbi:MAG: hypothetical protein KC464_18445 [Myxococcales bacterium]|nr:hypothetical protein [Myxococcales bacterium]